MFFRIIKFLYFTKKVRNEITYLGFENVLEHIYGHRPIKSSCEMTLEANLVALALLKPEKKTDC